MAGGAATTAFPLLFPVLMGVIDTSADRLNFMLALTEFSRWLANPSSCNLKKLRINEHNFLLIAGTFFHFEYFNDLANKFDTKYLINHSMIDQSQSTYDKIIGNSSTIFQDRLLDRLETSGIYY